MSQRAAYLYSNSSRCSTSRCTYNRSIPSRFIRKCYFVICCSFLFTQYLSIRLFYVEKLPDSVSSRLYPDRPLTLNLHLYSVCHPKELYVENITSYYHQYSNPKTCFLIEHLDGGPWWSYVTHEFAEILTQLKRLSIKSDIKYRSISYPIDIDYKTNLTKYFLNACQFSENFYLKRKIPIIVLLWDVNSLLWHEMHEQWNDLFQNTQTRLMAFIDDLHFVKKDTFLSRQYLFENLTSEIFSTYAYLFHNYYRSIPSSKITWLPHSASMSSYRSINNSAENKLFVSGAHLFDWYPCRARAFLLCLTRQDLTACLKHPGYAEGMKNDSSFFYGGKRYFSYMRQYVFGLGSCQSVHYAIAKLFEIPANGLALVTTDNLIPILEKLHLYYNEHFLTVQCSSVNQLEREVKLLRNISKEEINDIRIKSQKVVYERHTTQHRAELLHVRLLSQALIATTSSDKERRKWERWGRYCH